MTVQTVIKFNDVNILLVIDDSRTPQATKTVKITYKFNKAVY